MTISETMLRPRCTICRWVKTEVTTCHHAPVATPATQLFPLARQADSSAFG